MGFFDGFSNDENDDLDLNKERIKNNHRELRDVRGHLEEHPYDEDAQNREFELEERIEHLQDRRDEIWQSKVDSSCSDDDEDDY